MPFITISKYRAGVTNSMGLFRKYSKYEKDCMTLEESLINGDVMALLDGLSVRSEPRLPESKA